MKLMLSSQYLWRWLLSDKQIKAPEGFSRWSLRLLADKMIELQYVEEISYETVRRVLKKTN